MQLSVKAVPSRRQSTYRFLMEFHAVTEVNARLLAEENNSTHKIRSTIVAVNRRITPPQIAHRAISLIPIPCVAARHCTETDVI